MSQNDLTFIARDGAFAVWRGPWTWRRPYQVWAHPPNGRSWQVGADAYATPEEAAAEMYAHSRPPRHARKAFA